MFKLKSRYAENLRFACVFYTDLKIQEVKTLKNSGKMLTFEGPTVKFPYKSAVLAYKAIWDHPHTFSPENLKVAIHI